mmetsp:Transcript_103448/g.186678  ORF Transcript_103448/g.186678 Transcript_103448/m.186678 type:complete len:217 (-) Transcript_103448:93-743(-)
MIDGHLQRLCGLGEVGHLHVPILLLGPSALHRARLDHKLQEGPFDLDLRLSWSRSRCRWSLAVSRRRSSSGRGSACSSGSSEEILGPGVRVAWLLLKGSRVFRDVAFGFRLQEEPLGAVFAVFHFSLCVDVSHLGFIWALLACRLLVCGRLPRGPGPCEEILRCVVRRRWRCGSLSPSLAIGLGLGEEVLGRGLYITLFFWNKRSWGRQAALVRHA